MRLLQVGLGPWGRSWATSVLPKANGIEVVAYVDKDPAANAELGASPFFTDLDEALAQTKPDTVLGTIAINAHTAVALQALRAGKHLLLEKPFAPTLADAREILAEADRQGVVLAIAENYRLFPAVALVAELVRDEALGKVGQVRVDFRKSRDPVQRERDPIDLAILVQISIHHFDMMRAVLGQEPASVACRTWTPPWRDAPAHVSASATIEFDGGTVLTYTGSMASRGPDTPWAGEWHLECEGGEIVMSSRADDAGATDYVEVRPVDAEPYRPELPVFERTDRVGVLASFVDAVENGGQPSSPAADNLRSVALMDAAIRSSASGRFVAVELDS